MLSVSLMGCGNKEVEQPIIETTEAPVVQEEQELEVEEEKDKGSAFNDVLNTPKKEPVVEEKEEDNNTKYYEQLIIDKNEQDSKDKATQEENMKLANDLMGVCTDKLDNSTFIMEVVSKHTGLEETSLEIVQNAKKEGHTITEEDLQFVKKILNKLVGYDTVFLTDDNAYSLRMCYDGFEDIENKILKVTLYKSNAYKTDVIWERKMSRARLYKLVKEVLENGLNENIY